MTTDSLESAPVLAAGAAPVIAQFYDVIATVMADLKRERLGDIDLELLVLKKRELREKYFQTTGQLANLNRHAKAKAEQDIVSRGLGNTSLLASQLRALDRDAKAELISIGRDYSHALSEIALMERRVRENSIPWWRRWLSRK